MPKQLRSISRVMRRVLTWQTILVWISAAGAAAQDGISFERLIELTRAGAGVEAPSNAELSVLTESGATDDPLWPMRAYLQAEILLRLSRDDDANRILWSMVQWGLSPEGRDDSALTIVAFWRWLESAAGKTGGGAIPSDEVLRIAADLLQQKTNDKLFSYSLTGILPVLPQVRESTLLSLMLLAEEAKLQDQVDLLFEEYISSVDDLDPEAQRIAKTMIGEGQVSQESYLLRRAETLFRFSRVGDALDHLDRLRKAEDPQIEAKATLLRHRIRKTRGDPPKDSTIPLNALITDPSAKRFHEQAIYLRALAHKQANEPQRFEDDMRRLLKEYWGERYTDNALIELARHYQMQNDTARALEFFEMFDGYNGPTSPVFRSLSRIQRGLTYYMQWCKDGALNSLDGAREIFASLAKDYPAGSVINALARFWTARLALESEDPDSARATFEALQEDRRTEYYGVRAGIHLARFGERKGPCDVAASREVFPSPDTVARLAAVLERDDPPSEMDGESRYHARLRWAVESGLFQSLLETERRILDLYPSDRLQDLELGLLVENRWLPQMALLTALRIDAVNASGADAADEGPPDVAAYMGSRLGDWPLSQALVVGSKWSSDHEARLLGSTYPTVYLQELRQAVPKDAIVRSILYSIVRRETLFQPRAVSGSGALGLLQFMPATFDSLNARYNLVDPASEETIRGLLFEPGSALRFGAVHYRDLLESFGGAHHHAIMAHNSRPEAVRTWVESWSLMGEPLTSDIEFQVETARATQTRIFLRGVMSDVALERDEALLNR